MIKWSNGTTASLCAFTLNKNKKACVTVVTKYHECLPVELEGALRILSLDIQAFNLQFAYSADVCSGFIQGLTCCVASAKAFTYHYARNRLRMRFSVLGVYKMSQKLYSRFDQISCRMTDLLACYGIQL